MTQIDETIAGPRIAHNCHAHDISLMLISSDAFFYSIAIASCPATICFYLFSTVTNSDVEGYIERVFSEQYSPCSCS